MQATGPRKTKRAALDGALHPTLPTRRSRSRAGLTQPLPASPAPEFQTAIRGPLGHHPENPIVPETGCLADHRAAERSDHHPETKQLSRRETTLPDFRGTMPECMCIMIDNPKTGLARGHVRPPCQPVAQQLGLMLRPCQTVLPAGPRMPGDCQAKKAGQRPTNRGLLRDTNQPLGQDWRGHHAVRASGALKYLLWT